MAGFRPAGRVPFCSGSASVLQEVSPPAGGELLSGCPERSQRGTRGKLRMSASRSYSLPPGPHYGGRVPVEFCRISGAQNLSDTLNSRRATGPWVCKNYRWCSSTSAPGFSQPTLPVQIPAGDPRASPTQTWTQYSHAVGAGPRPARRPPEPHLSPTRPKGALLEYIPN